VLAPSTRKGRAVKRLKFVCTAGTECNVMVSLTAVVFSIRKWSSEVHECVMGDSTSLSLVVVLMGRAINGLSNG
jgi:hypothetical protein